MGMYSQINLIAFVKYHLLKVNVSWWKENSI